MSDVEYIGAGVGVRVCELFGNPYVVNGTPPFRDLNIEQQAKVVEDWVSLSPAARSRSLTTDTLSRTYGPDLCDRPRREDTFPHEVSSSPL
jgi:hypothetical protein